MGASPKGFRGPRLVSVEAGEEVEEGDEEEDGEEEGEDCSPKGLKGLRLPGVAGEEERGDRRWECEMGPLLLCCQSCFVSSSPCHPPPSHPLLCLCLSLSFPSPPFSSVFSSRFFSTSSILFTYQRVHV